MHHASNFGLKSLVVGEGMPSIKRLVIIKKSMGGRPISPIGKWKVWVTDDHLLAKAIIKALSTFSTSRLRKGPKPLAHTLSWTLEHIRPHNV